MKLEDKLQMFHTRAYQSLVFLVENAVADWVISAKDPVYKLYKKSEKQSSDTLRTILLTKSLWKQT